MTLKYPFRPKYFSNNFHLHDELKSLRHFQFVVIPGVRYFYFFKICILWKFFSCSLSLKYSHSYMSFSLLSPLLNISIKFTFMSSSGPARQTWRQLLEGTSRTRRTSWTEATTGSPTPRLRGSVEFRFIQ